MELQKHRNKKHGGHSILFSLEWDHGSERGRGVEGVVQLIDYLLSMHEVLGSIPSAS